MIKKEEKIVASDYLRTAKAVSRMKVKSAVNSKGRKEFDMSGKIGFDYKELLLLRMALCVTESVATHNMDKASALLTKCSNMPEEIRDDLVVLHDKFHDLLDQLEAELEKNK